MYHRLKYTNKYSIFRDGKPAAERMKRTPLRNTGNVKKVESTVSNDGRHTVRYLSKISDGGKPTVHRILKSDLKLSKVSARWVLLYLVTESIIF